MSRMHSVHSKQHFYLHHRTVYKNTMSKIKVVLNTLKESNAKSSLNETLLVGPVIQHKIYLKYYLLSVFMRHRHLRRKKFYRQIIMQPTLVFSHTGVNNTVGLLQISNCTNSRSFLKTYVTIRYLCEFKQEPYILN